MDGIGDGGSSHCFSSSENHRQAYAQDFSLGHDLWMRLFGLEEIVEKVLNFFGLKIFSCTVFVDSISHALGDERSKWKSAGLVVETLPLKP